MTIRDTPLCRKCKQPLEVHRREYPRTTFVCGYCWNSHCKMRHFEIYIENTYKEGAATHVFADHNTM